MCQLFCPLSKDFWGGCLFAAVVVNTGDMQDNSAVKMYFWIALVITNSTEKRKEICKHLMPQC